MIRWALGPVVHCGMNKPAARWGQRPSPRRSSRGRRVLLPALLAVASLPAVAGCGGGGSSSSSKPAPATPPAASRTAKVDIANFAYHPPAIVVRAGAKVTWTNSDATAHTATSQDQTTFDTGILNHGDSKMLTFSHPGTFRYFCRFHPFMHGTVVVK